MQINPWVNVIVYLRIVHRITRKITHTLGPNSRLIFSRAAKVQTPSDASMEVYYRDLAKATNFFVCAPYVVQKISLEIRRRGGAILL